MRKKVPEREKSNRIRAKKYKCVPKIKDENIKSERERRRRRINSEREEEEQKEEESR